MSDFTLNTTARTQTGRSASRRLRRANQIPAILYGKHSEPASLVIAAPEFRRLLKVMGGRAVLVELNQEGSSDKTLSYLQEVQRDPLTNNYLHIDFHEVKAGEKIDLQVPVTITGESAGVKNQNGVLEITTHELHVRCLPKDLPATISVDISALDVGEMIKVSELTAIDGVEFLDDEGQPVVICAEAVEEIVEEVVEEAATDRKDEGAEAAPAAEADAEAEKK
jgi:large subunit ribosomal protein L25